ncbi:MAG: hypothetical protein IT239_07045, partial [Bacteroidia bacterium]|nr:hypothetical protein [Bacteroidia bacterium]
MLHLKYFLFLLIIPQFLYSQTTVTDTSLQRRIREKEESSQFALPPGFPTARLGYPVNNGVYTTGPEQDCNGAIPVCNSTYSQNSSYSGTGSTQEVPTSSCLGSREKNSVWYVFTVSASGNLAFQITPNAGSEDYDFALYNITGKSCSDIPSGAATESRCNYSATGGSTGLSSSGSNPSEPASGPNQSTLLPVTVGQTFVLVVSNYSSSQNGYTLNFASSGMTASVFDNVKPTVSSVNAPCGSSTVTVQMSEPIVCSTIASNGSDFSLSGPGGPFTISSATGVNCGTSTSQIQFTVSPALVMGNTYTLTVNQGVDANTLLDNCGNYADAGVTTNFTVSNPPASISGNNNICNGSSTALSANSGTSYAWSTGATTQTINVSPSSNTTYTVTVSNGTCGNSTANVTVSVKPSPVPDFTFPASVCAGTPVTFTNTTQMPPSCGGNGLINCTTIGSSTQCGFISTCQATSLTAPVVVATWAFGNASTSFNPNPPNPSQTYNTPGTYTVSLYMSLPITGCSNTISHDIVVLPNAGTLSITGDTLICPGGTANLTASGSASYTWTQGGNTISNNATISVTPASTTTYTVAAPGCSSNITKTITVVVSNS